MARRGAGAVLIGSVALAVGSVALRPAVAAASQMFHVIVDNTDENPVPVRGTVNVGNLPSSEAAPKPAPFEARADTTLTPGIGFGSAFITIPAGQQLTAEFLSVKVIVPPDQVPQVSFNASDGATGGFVPLTFSGTTDGLNGPIANYTAALPIREFQTGTFAVALSRDLPQSFQYPGDAHLSVYLSGYLNPA
jgi:hypothetical protein